VLQERLLASRVLHFAKEQLFWECKKLCASETYPHGLPAVISRDDLQQVLKQKRENRLAEKGPLYLLKCESLPPFNRSYEKIEGAEEIDDAEVDLWYRIVAAYSQTSLTFAADKLPALSGVAKFFQSTPKDTYLAGIWKSHLPNGLAWHIQSFPETALPRPKNYRAPTWSWMSVEYPVTIAKYSAFPILRILDAHTTLTSVDPTGPVSGGLLVVEGVLTPVTWKRAENHMYIDGKVLSGSVILLDDVPEGIHPLEGEIDGFALPLLEYTDTVKREVNSRYQRVTARAIGFLFLQPVQNCPGHFTRIGFGLAESNLEQDELMLVRDINTDSGATFVGHDRGYKLTLV
jgi:hypothetical protein